MPTAIIIVDHGSRRDASNKMLEQVAALFYARFEEKYEIVEPAHMELAEPSIATAYARCAERGATQIIVCPFFLGPGKHWTSDIPRLTAEAAADFPGTRYHVAQTLGIDDLILDLLDKRATHCVDHNLSCDVCQGTLRSGEKGIEIPQAASSHAAVPMNAVLCGTCPFRETAK
jgi:sirohydrochlorin ferrochelatase